PVTEMTTGLDLVALQLDLAAGGDLPLAQVDVTRRGAAVEVRLYAEDPTRGFLPQSGRILHFDVPAGPFIRVDSGVETGSAVPVFYDPLLAKIIAWGATREDAYDRLARVLDATIVHGIATNLAFLRAVVSDPDVR